ncbi:MAG TPA: 3-phosphoshikimate 1-carboxyvinyltransferase [Rudaea sp.]|nr:3-phosphoshikimate 1-carboxyvinyltransferase [Rudaea sp.]
MNSSRVDWTSAPSSALQGGVQVPGDKSISHRAIMLAAIAEGSSRITGFLEGEDTRATARAFANMGVHIESPRDNERVVHGVGLYGLRRSPAPIDCGNAGTGMRLLTGLLAGQRFDSTLIGDASLSRRPMRRVMDPLNRMNAGIDSDDGLPPLRVRGNQTLSGIRYEVPIASAQVKSAILLAGLYARGETEVIEPHPTRDYTERMLAAFGSPVEFGPCWAKVVGGHPLCAADIDVPGDFSSAAFFVVASTIVAGSQLTIKNVGMNPRRTGLLQVLRLMGADIRETSPHIVGGEQVCDLAVRSAPLRGIDVPMEHVPDMIDEFPILFIAAAAARGTTRITGAAELRIKESDRIAVMAAGLRTLGVAVEETPDGALITGGKLSDGEVDSAGDHRCAMSFVIAGAVASAAVAILDCAHVATSFPGFVETANRCGLGVSVR